MDVPEEYGGGGVDDFRYNLVIGEESSAASAPPGSGWTLHNDICLPYFLRYCNDEQKAALAAGHRSGELITAIAMTEPGIGSDLASMRPPRSATATTTSSTARRRSSPTASTPTS
jgi:alkylation response protein AidB-like acyl-CoA dehydrogenase